MKTEPISETAIIYRLLERLVLVGGAPRGGTTFAVKSLNLHPAVMAAVDDHVYECWGLYYYRDRTGLVQELRDHPMSTDEVRSRIKLHLCDGENLVGAAPSPKTAGYPEICNSLSRKPGGIKSLKDENLVRYVFPLDRFSPAWYLCLKSPEICLVLPQLATHFPGAKFVLVYRPIIEIAESMYRLGGLVKRFPVFQERWKQAREEKGEILPPPGVPGEWYSLWQTAGDFQRCVIYAASYLRGLNEGTGQLERNRYIVYNHASLRRRPKEIFQKLARFLDIDVSGFKPASRELNPHPPGIPDILKKEYAGIEKILELETLLEKIESLATEDLGG